MHAGHNSAYHRLELLTMSLSKRAGSIETLLRWDEFGDASGVGKKKSGSVPPLPYKAAVEGSLVSLVSLGGVLMAHFLG